MPPWWSSRASNPSRSEVMESQFRRPYEELLKNARPDLYRRLQGTGDLSSHLDEVARVADQEFDSICAQLRDYGPEPTSRLGKANHAWMLESQAFEMVMDTLPIRDDDLVPDIYPSDGPEAA